MYLDFQTIPVSSLTTIKPADRAYYLTQLFSLEKKVQNVLFSEDTGAYVRGLSKSYNIDINLSPKIALTVLFIAIGEKTFAQLPAILSTELQLPNDKAQKMAAEIEKDLFGPVRGELDEFLRTQKKSKGSIVGRIGSASPTPTVQQTQSKPPASPQNILNLKELPQKKPQASLPPRPAQKDLPIRKPRTPLPPPHNPTSPRLRGAQGEKGTVPKRPQPPHKPIIFT